MTAGRLVVALSGASGAIYGIRLLQVLQAVAEVETHLVVTPAAGQTISLETDWTVRDVERLADVVHRYRDVTASISSGSFETMGMVVIPCSMDTLSQIASSSGGNLVARAADVTLKERRRLVLVTRETPLHLGHLRLMVQVTETGAIVMPPMPAWYHRPSSIEDLVDQTVNRVLDQLGIRLERDLFRRWSGPGRAGPEPVAETPDVDTGGSLP
jgi:4-hydroxy-3-polyprenylbenzoate decarboxylase